MDRMMKSRRQILSLSGATVLGTQIVKAYSNKDDKNSNDDTEKESKDCGGYIKEDSNKLLGEPDFVVNGEVKADVYWMPGSHFQEVFGRTFIVGYADSNNNRIALNKNVSAFIDNNVILHEYGHLLGYGHIDNTVMAPNTSKLKEAADGSLTATDEDIFRRCEDTHICDWKEDEIEPLGYIASQYVNSTVSIESLGYAASEYASNGDTDAYYKTSWNQFGGQSGVPNENYFDGEFFR